MPEKIDLPSKTNDSATKILASWSYGAAEWEQFLQWRMKEIIKKCSLLVIIALAAFALILYFVVSLQWYVALGSGAGLGLLLYLIQPYCTGLYGFRFQEQLPEVIITTTSVLTNNAVEYFAGPDRNLHYVAIIETRQLNILEINFSISGKRRTLITVPIQRGKLKEALKVQELLMQTITLGPAV